MTYQFLKHPEDPTNHKVLGAGGWYVDRDEGGSLCYTGIWKDGHAVALVMGRGDAHEALDAAEIVRETCTELVKRLNGYDVLLEYFNASVAFNNAHGDGPEGERLSDAVARSNRAEARLENALQAVYTLLKKGT